MNAEYSASHDKKKSQYNSNEGKTKGGWVVIKLLLFNLITLIKPISSVLTMQLPY